MPQLLPSTSSSSNLRNVYSTDSAVHQPQLGCDVAFLRGTEATEKFLAVDDATCFVFVT
jgi:hypothetical protein